MINQKTKWLCASEYGAACNVIVSSEYSDQRKKIVRHKLQLSCVVCSLRCDRKRRREEVDAENVMICLQRKRSVTFYDYLLL